MKSSKKIIFFGRSNDIYSKRLIHILRKKFKYLTTIYSSSYNEKFPKKALKWKGDYILSFRSYYILKENFIKRAKHAAINFHPGPPKYRGVGCLNYALYNNEKYYGVTAHLMTKKIDQGKIIAIKKFKIYSKDNLAEVLSQTHKELFSLTLKIINSISKNKLYIKNLLKKFKNEKWSKNIRNKKDLDNFYKISFSINKKELNRLIRSTYLNNYRPYILLHGRKFYYEK